MTDIMDHLESDEADAGDNFMASKARKAMKTVAITGIVNCEMLNRIYRS